jgi:hypothetical protein
MVACSSEYILYRAGILHFKTPMASNVWTSVWAFAGGTTVTILTTLLTEAPEPINLKGLTYSYSARLRGEGPWYTTPEFYALVVGAAFVFLNWKFF